MMIDKEGDRQVLEALSNHGSDLSKAHHIVYYFYFKSKRSAQEVAQQLENEGYKIQRVGPAPSSWWKRLFGTVEWACIVEKLVVPEEHTVFKTTDRFNKIAATYGGEYDGWEAGIVR
jgi:hypothetical protein